MESLDSDLKKRWEILVQQRAEGGHNANDMNREKESIRRGWKEVLDKRKKGTLTDTTRTDMVAKTIKEVALFSEFKVETDAMECTSNELFYAEMWSVRMFYAGKKADFKLDRWEKMAKKINSELEAFDFVKEHDRLMVDFINDDEMFATMKPPDDSVPEDQLWERAFSTRVAAVIWRVDTWVWYGPNEDKESVFPSE